MLTLPDAIVPVLHPFATLFRNPTWRKAQILLGRRDTGSRPTHRSIGAPCHGTQRPPQLRSLPPGAQSGGVVAPSGGWHPARAAAPASGPGRWSVDLRHTSPVPIRKPWSGVAAPKSNPMGIYRDAVRSSRSHLVKASGLRWISLMWLGQVPWAGRYWALPFFTVLAPSARYYRQRGRRHKKLTDWARQMLLQPRSW